MAEHRFCKPTVVGSTPTLGSTIHARDAAFGRRLRAAFLMFVTNVLTNS